jgi:hypothetical protein
MPYSISIPNPLSQRHVTMVAQPDVPHPDVEIDDGLVVGKIGDACVIFNPKTGRTYTQAQATEASLRDAIARGLV